MSLYTTKLDKPEEMTQRCHPIGDSLPSILDEIRKNVTLLSGQNSHFRLLSHQNACDHNHVWLILFSRSGAIYKLSNLNFQEEMDCGCALSSAIENGK